MRFLVTEESRRLARWVRLMGYDTEIVAAQPLSALYRKAYNESRVIVTRNQRVRASSLFRVVQLASPTLPDQLRQLRGELELTAGTGRAFSRCDVCNAEVQPMERSLAKERVPPYVYQTQRAFSACPSCQRVYWAATHWQRVRRLFDRLSEDATHA